jgi:glyoxylase-like metal-dependent hydrolase (beta-lactamase superfamily II)
MIPFVRDFDFEYGRVDQVSPLIRRVIAKNPGPFTYTGTGTYIIGQNVPGATLALIDPGPELEDHLEAILVATAGQSITHIFISHAHMDHSPLARRLADITGAVIYAGAEPCIPSDGDARLEAGDDLDFRPDVALNDGQIFNGTGWSLEAMATPGHTQSHYAYVLLEEQALFPGDCIMGWSTTVIGPPDGDMGQYMQSLRKIRAREFNTLWPTHGPPVTDIAPFVDAYIAHRLHREGLIVAALEEQGASTIRELLPHVYAGLERRLQPAACHSMLAHLIDLVRRGDVKCEDAPTISSVFSPKVVQHA